MPRRVPMEMGTVFPMGAYLVGEVEAVQDFEKSSREAKVQALCKDTGLRLWSVQVLDADEGAGKREKTVMVKIAAEHQPVPPENKTPFPFTPVSFVGLEAVPYVDDNGPRPRLAWSFRAREIHGEPVPRASKGGEG